MKSPLQKYSIKPLKLAPFGLGGEWTSKLKSAENQEGRAILAGREELLLIAFSVDCRGQHSGSNARGKRE
jgi:hypothetical protein